MAADKENWDFVIFITYLFNEFKVILKQNKIKYNCER